MKRSTVFLVFALLICAVIASVCIAYQVDYFQIASIEINGAKKVSLREILRRSDIREGYSNIFFNSKKTAENILDNRWITDVHIRKQYPDKVIVEVTEMEPFAILVESDETLYYISREGKILGPTNFSEGLDFPVIISNGISSTELIRKALQILALSENSNVLNWKEISEINVDPIFGISVYTRDERRIDFGNGDFKSKWSKLEKIITHSRSMNLLEKYINIGAGNTGTVNYRL